MSLVVAVAEVGSLSAASRKLGTPLATVSRKLSDLEMRLKTQLFRRSSRQMNLTDAGRSYIEACKLIIELVEKAEQAASEEYRKPAGELVVTAPLCFGHKYLMPIACDFLAAYPDIGLRLLLSDQVLRPIEDNIDVSIRIGNLPDSSMLATRVGSVRIVACASPAYLSVRGRPESLSDLQSHDCIMIDNGSASRTLKSVRGGHALGSPIRSRLTVNTSDAAIEAALAGAGIARVMLYKIEDARRSGALEIVLETFEDDPLPLHIMYSECTVMPLKLRLFLDWVTPRLKARMQRD